MTPDEFRKLPILEYHDWFGTGSNNKDFNEVVAEHGEPIEVLQDEFMLAIIYSDKIIVIGYDGNEYHTQFTFKR